MLLGSAIQIEELDIIVISLYFVVIVGVGLWAGLKRKDHSGSAGYFLAGSTLTWPVIGMALFSTNISTIHMIGFAEEGYINGLAYGNFEWMAPFLLIVLALFFAPFYLRSRVTTLPDFLERRYCSGCRNWLAALSIISAVFIHIGFTLYAGALVIKALFGIEIMTSIIVAAVLTGIYTIVGGLLAVVVTGAMQTVILLLGSIIITVLAMKQVGGWGGLTELVEPAKLSILRPASDPANLPWYSVFLGYPVIGLWYWCADQTIVQRVLGAKDENHARVGPLFAGFLKILPVFIFFLPGVIYLAMVNKGAFPPLKDSGECFSFAIRDFLPAGLTGLMAAALLAALMSTVSGAMNSIATLFSYDLYKQWKPETSDKKLIMIGQIATVVSMIIAILWSPLIARFESIYQGISAIICYIAPPITTVFAFGVFWKKASNKAALLTLFLGTAMGVAVFFLDWFKEYTNWNVAFMMASFYLFCLCSLIMIIASFIWPHKHTEQSIKLVWKNPLEALSYKGWKGLANYKLLSGLLFVSLVVCYVIFAVPDLKPAETVTDLSEGLSCSYYTTEAASQFQLKDAMPVGHAVAMRLELDEAIPSEATVIKYAGYINVAADGKYRFFINSAQKLDIRIGKATLSLWDDSEQLPPSEGLEKNVYRKKFGEFDLRQGTHSIELYYYADVPFGTPKEGEEELFKAAFESAEKTFDIYYESKDIEKTTIPDSDLYHKEEL